MPVKLKSGKRAIGRTIVAVIVVIVILILAAGAYALTAKSATTTTSQATQTSSASSATTSSPVSVSSTQSSSATTSSPTSTQGVIQTLNIADEYWPYGVDLNPQDMYGDTPYPLWSQYSVYQTLVNVNQTAEYEEGIYQYVPGLAMNWTVSADGSTYTFNLRQGVTYSNGDPFNAYEVWMNCYGYFYSSGNSSTWVFGNPIFNMTGVVIGNATFSAIQSSGGLSAPTGQVLAMMQNTSWPVYVTSPYQVVFHMDTSYPYMLGLFIGSPGLIFDNQYVLNHGGYGISGAVPGNSYLDLNPPPGTGPYEFANVSEGSYVEYIENPTYWGNNLTAAQIDANPALQPGHVEAIHIQYIPDELSRYTGLASGTWDMTQIETDMNIVEANPSQYGYLTLPAWSANVEDLALDTQKYPTNITDFRLAIAHDINYSALNATAFKGYLSPFIGPETPGWKQFYNLNNQSGPYEYTYNQTLAEQYLNESGVNVATLQPLEITAPQGPAFISNCLQIVQSDLANIGIPSNIVTQTESNYELPYSQSNLTLRGQEAGQLSILGGGGYGPSGVLVPSDYWVTFTTANGGGNWAAYNNSAVNNEVYSFFRSNNITYIQSQLKLAQQQVYNDAPYVYLGITLPSAGGDTFVVWNNKVISHFWYDASWGGVMDLPILNTITFTNGQ